MLWLIRREWWGYVVLDGEGVPGITPSLTRGSADMKAPSSLVENLGVAARGVMLVGAGFVLDREETEQLLASNPANAAVIRPFLGGDEVNKSPTFSAHRSVIDFRDWALGNAKQFPEPLAIVRERVKPGRDKNKIRDRRERWWQFAGRARALMRASAELDEVIVFCRVSKYLTPALVPTESVLSDRLTVIALSDYASFGVLASFLHEQWALRWGGKHGMAHDATYTPEECFETFPRPRYDAAVEAAGKALDQHRSALTIRNDEGLTKTYNRVHNPDDDSPGIPELRELHVALDLAVRDAYGWADLDLDYGFHDTPQGRRFTFGPAARAEVLDRLLELNHQRYAEEVANGLHDKKKSGGRRKRTPLDAPTLL